MLLSIIRITEILEQDHDKHMKDYITSLVTRGINVNQNDSENHTYYYDYNFLEKENNKCWQGCAEIGTLGYC